MNETVHTSLCDGCDVVMKHRTETETNDWVFGHAREVHNTILGEADVMDLAEGRTERFIWPRNLSLDAEAEVEANGSDQAAGSDDVVCVHEEGESHVGGVRRSRPG